MQAPDIKDAISAILGASISLAGLLLIFSGFLFAQAATLKGRFGDDVVNRFKLAARCGLGPFAFAIILALAALGYWYYPSASYALDIARAFIALALVTLAYGILAACLL